MNILENERGGDRHLTHLRALVFCSPLGVSAVFRWHNSSEQKERERGERESYHVKLKYIAAQLWRYASLVGMLNH